MNRDDLRRLFPFRGPGQTLFLHDVTSRSCIVLAQDGTEAVVPEDDMLALLSRWQRLGPSPPRARGLEELLPEPIRVRLEAPERAREDKVTTRFTEAQYRILEKLAEERGEPISALVRRLAMAQLDLVDHE